jgi:hypothetical protein
MYGTQRLRCFGSWTMRIAAIASVMLALGVPSKPNLAWGTASGVDFQILDGVVRLVLSKNARETILPSGRQRVVDSFIAVHADTKVH